MEAESRMLPCICAAHPPYLTPFHRTPSPSRDFPSPNTHTHTLPPTHPSSPTTLPRNPAAYKRPSSLPRRRQFAVLTRKHDGHAMQGPARWPPGPVPLVLASPRWTTHLLCTCAPDYRLPTCAPAGMGLSSSSGADGSRLDGYLGFGILTSSERASGG
ncbi:hypothetical protein BS50DRAFT_324002 [Corynespora cassiicola Philippines]|uniref:Uncharacterized protein n=1 Tax=Corynespora cassiicola Philippines TaxID=1448308 RepID=A0A2T2NUK2_CORCC|nr:hypothetical protein BS50DRAFT_324002 [Corynespora cassiicola Philippines]